jgi:glycosyltransferase involved in cell wall biosynthesis
MKLLIVSQYFWPENFRVNDLAIGLANKGHEVTVLTGYPNYPEGKIYKDFKENKKKYKRLHNVNIIRVPIISRGNNLITLFLNYISFPISAIFQLFLNKKKIDFDRVITYQLSPIFLALPAIYIKKICKIPVIIWTLDLWPETLSNYGFSNKNWIYKLVKRFTKYIYRNSDLILLQTQKMKEKMHDYGSEIDFKSRYMPSWAEEIFNVENIKKQESNVFKIIFAGNVGDAQDCGSILECMKIVQKKDPNICLEIIGDGSMLINFKSKARESGLENIVFRGRHPVESMPKFYSSADAFLVTLKNSVAFEYVLPAKAQSYMLSKKPIIGMANGETKKIINEAECGVCVSSGDFKNLAKEIITLKNSNQQIKQNYGINGFEYCVKNYDKKTLIDEFESYLFNL